MILSYRSEAVTYLPDGGTDMARNRVVQGRMVTNEHLAELIEGDPVMAADPIKDTERDCPDCGGNVLTVGYMPSATEYVDGYKCQDCDWAENDRD